MMPLWPVLLVLIVVVVAVLWARRPGAARLVTRRPRKRHWLTRAICGTLAVIILAAVGIGTWHTVQRSYSVAAPAPGGEALVPTLPPPPPPAGEDQIVDKARLLVNVALVSLLGERRTILDLEQHVLAYPAPTQRTFVLDGDGTRVRFDLYIQQVRTGGRRITARTRIGGDPEITWDQAPGLYASARMEVTWNGRWPTGGMSQSGGGFPLSGLFRQAVSQRWDKRSMNPLSIVPPPAHIADTFLVCYAVPLAEDDPMRKVGLEEFARVESDTILGAIRDEEVDDMWARQRESREEMPVGAIALADHIGLSTFLLLAAAVLLAQLFARWPMALAGTLAAVILYVAVLDRLVLRANLGVLNDPAAPPAARMLACRQAGRSFFYLPTARRALGAVAADAAAPPEVRKSAADAAKW